MLGFVCIGLLLSGAGCTQASLLQGQVDGFRELLQQAQRNGAYRCAPRELALAEAEIRFAEVELSQGDQLRVAEHLAVAEPNLKAAVRMSPAERCSPRDVQVETTPADTDGDGLLDPEDQCPEEPEDFDGVADEDGCPEDQDTDGDKIMDSVDVCPKVPEDFDGIADEDGCPEDQDTDVDGLPDSIDKCPRQPEDVDGIQDEDGCPEDQDTDGDGILDSADLCIVVPEDADGYLDADGCPDPDNDADRILDVDDRCVDVPEDPDGYQDEDGCPDDDNDADGIKDASDECPNEVGPPAEQGCPKKYEDVVVTETKIEIKQKVFFDFNKAVIQSRSFGLLNTVASVMGDYDNIRVEIQGHTDDRGSDKYNLKLSQERANAVRRYLTSQGVSPGRLTAVGYGETRPIDSNRTVGGREVNRRVEFLRTDEDAAAAADED